MRSCRLRSVIAVFVGLHLSVSPLAALQPDISKPVALPQVVDVALTARAELRGEIRGSEAQPRPHASVELWRADQKVRVARSDAAGRFRFGDVAGGVYQLRSGDSVVVCRVWTASVAPPRAAGELLLVARNTTVRGQQPLNEVFCFNPFVMGTIISSAVAIPIAVHDSGDGQLEDGS